jgi:hypothetical protein
MFDFLNMMNNYESRKVGRWDNDDGTRMVSTASVSDGIREFETAFKHPDYNEGNSIIVEAYDTKDEALAGHEYWVKVMTDGPLPDELVDCANAHTAQSISANLLRFSRRTN